MGGAGGTLINRVNGGEMRPVGERPPGGMGHGGHKGPGAGGNPQWGLGRGGHLGGPFTWGKGGQVDNMGPRG